MIQAEEICCIKQQLDYKELLSYQIQNSKKLVMMLFSIRTEQEAHFSQAKLTVTKTHLSSIRYSSASFLIFHK